MKKRSKCNPCFVTGIVPLIHSCSSPAVIAFMVFFFPMEDLKLTAEFVNIDDVFFWRMEFMMLALCDLLGWRSDPFNR